MTHKHPNNKKEDPTKALEGFLEEAGGTIVDVDKKAIKENNRDEKVAKEPMIATLQNLESHMKTTATLLTRCGHKDRANELKGAADQIAEWRFSIEFEKEKE